jgi:3-phenylpropionate/trans-cinnamate dioxygenase ferredoxin reductase component
MTPDRVVIVGAGLAGSRCAQTLRAQGFERAVILIGEEPHPPYERPALSKEYLAGRRTELALQPAAYWEENDIRLVLGTRVERIDLTRKLIRTTEGDIGWDALVLATGARPRCLPGMSGPGVHVLRTLSDAERLRTELVPGRRLAIVGAGFVGAEVASTALALGLDVTIVDSGRVPFERTLGDDIGTFLAHRYRAHGVDLRLETGATRLRRDSRGALRAVALADGAELPCDLLLVAAGAEPVSDLVGLPAGIPTAADGRTALAGVYACGDAAAPWHPTVAAHVRLEHWTSAGHHAATVARTILGAESAGAPTPYFWTDQFGLRLQHVGYPLGSTRVVLAGDAESLEARYLDAHDRLVAALLVNRPQAVSQLRRQLATEPLAA